MPTADGGNCSPLNLPKIFLNSAARDRFVSSGAILTRFVPLSRALRRDHPAPRSGGDTIGLLDIVVVNHSRERSIIASKRQIATYHALNTNFLSNEPLLLASFCFGNASFRVWHF